ncbi:MAG: EAL domain-containing protein [Leptospiraceae bacterium]|nr:EAL domain-containing protein [Leptospiraceae bacterium]
MGRNSENIPLSILLENTLFGFAFIQNRVILRANHKLAELFGLRLEQILDRDTEHLYADKTIYDEVGHSMYNLLRANGEVRFERPMRRSDGSLFYCRFEGRALDRSRPEEGSVWTLTDVTREHRDRERALLHTGLFEKSAQAIMITDGRAAIIAVNSSFTRITGYEEWEVLGRNPRIFQSGLHDSDFYANLWSSLRETGQWYGEIWNRRKDGEVFPELLQIIAIRNQQNQFEHFVAIFSDLSGRKEMEAQLKRASSLDALTGLPHRAALLDHMRSQLFEMAPNKRLAVLALDINQFRRFNQADGLDIGDQVLSSFGSRLQKVIGPRDFAARLDGDEFIILHCIQEMEGLLQVAQGIIASLTEPYHIQGVEYQLDLRVGISVAPDDGNSPEVLIQYATLAQNRERSKVGNSIEFFRHGMNLRSQRFLKLERELRHAIQAREFQVHFQPQFSSDAHQIVGLEALVRWQHPAGKLMMPGLFIPAAEDLGCIREINQQVLRMACAQAATWLQSGYSFGHLAVNCSAPDLLTPDFAASVVSVLQETGFPAECLTLEITESMAIIDPQKTALVLHDLRSKGIRVAMDDFGTGYCSINTLRSIPIDFLKLDKSFVRDMLTDTEARVLTETILTMSKVLGYSVVAEGVENKQQLDLLTALGCQTFQGFLLARPMSSGSLEKLLAESVP